MLNIRFLEVNTNEYYSIFGYNCVFGVVIRRDHTWVGPVATNRICSSVGFLFDPSSILNIYNNHLSSSSPSQFQHPKHGYWSIYQQIYHVNGPYVYLGN
jgi:hypothetical protein